jgi:hypothetical protein
VLRRCPRRIAPEEKRQAGVQNVLFKLVKKKRGRSYLDNCGDPVPNPDNNNIPERIWLLAGATSIWESKVEHILKDKSRYDRARRGMDIVFVDGVCRVRSTDLLRLEFMRKNLHNVGKNRSGAGPFDYFEYDPAQEQKDREAKQMLKIEMVLKVKDMEESRVERLASYFGITFVDELGVRKTPAALRTELMLKADTDPVNFQKYMDSKEVDVSYMIKRAIIDAKIDLGGESKNVTWAAGHGYIAKVPLTRKPLEYLTELAMTNSDEGRKFLEQLKQNIT